MEITQIWTFNTCAYVNMYIQAAAVPYLELDHKVTRCLPCEWIGHYNVKGSNLDLPIMHLWQYYLVGKIQALYQASALGLYLAPYTVCTVLLYPVLYIPGTRALYLAS